MNLRNSTRSAAVQRQKRCAWNDLLTAQSILTAGIENMKTAVHAPEVATDRYKVGVYNHADVLIADAALTETRGSYVDALRGYSAARAALVRDPQNHQNQSGNGQRMGSCTMRVSGKCERYHQISGKRRDDTAGAHFRARPHRRNADVEISKHNVNENAS